MPDINGNDNPELEEQHETEKAAVTWSKSKQAEFEVFMEDYIDTHFEELKVKFEEWLDLRTEQQWEARCESWFA